MIRFALRRRVSTFVGTVTLVALGTFALARLPVALLPTLERPRLVLVVEAPSHSREELLRGLTEPWERRLSSLAGLSSMRTETEDGLVRVSLETDWNADADRLRVEAARLIEGAGSLSPERIEWSVAAGDATPVVEVAVTGGADAVRRGRFAEEVVRPELARCRGGGRVDVVGAVDERVVVRPRAADLLARGLTAADVEARLQELGRPSPAGRVQDGAVVRALVARESVGSLGELGALRLGPDDTSAALRDVANLSLEQIAERGRFVLDDEEAVLLRAWRAPGANAVALARSVRARLAPLRAAAPAGIELTLVTDRSREVVAALSQLGLAAFTGVLLGTLVLRLLLGRWSVTLALGLVIPASVLASLLAFHLFSVPLDVISLAGLTLAAGLLVDNSIVVLESIESARARDVEEPELAGTRQVALAVVASSATTLVVFLPLLYVRGLARAFFGEQAFAVAAALTASLLFSLTLTPVLAGRRRLTQRSRNPGRASYLAVLGVALRRPVLTSLLALAVVALGLATLLVLPRQLLPAAPARVLRIDHRLPPQLSRERSRRHDDELLARTREVLAGTEQPQLVSLVRGLPELDALALANGAPARHGRVELHFEDARRAGVAAGRLADGLASLPGVSVTVGARPSAFVEAVAWAGRGFEVVVSAADEARAEALADRAADFLAQRTGARPESRGSGGADGTALFVDWDERRLAELGLQAAALERALRPALSSTELGRLTIGGRPVGLRLEATLTPALELLPVAARPPEGFESGAVSPPACLLGGLASVRHGPRAQRSVREDGRPARRLSVSLPPGTDLQRLGRAVASLRGASDESVTLAGEAAELARSFGELRLALALSLVLAFLTLAAVHESLVAPLLIMTTVPVAAAGGLGLLLLTGQGLDLMSFLGLILLGGLVVNNAIVLLHRVQQRLEAGEPHHDALRQAAAERFRPIVMTTATTVFGMLPLALLGGEGAELRRALATAVLGGLVTSMPAALLLVPALHVIAFGRRLRRAR